MTGTLYNTSYLDANGRSLLLDDTVIITKFYSSENESWDRGGSGSSWVNELQIPTDDFVSSSYLADRWLFYTDGSGSYSQGGTAMFSLDGSQGTAQLSSEGLWSLTGDFNIRLYINWDDYHNEYRSETDSFLDVAYDSANAIRL